MIALDVTTFPEETYFCVQLSSRLMMMMMMMMMMMEKRERKGYAQGMQIYLLIDSEIRQC
tara:strand:+ start:382 stop:561 length:180 start_codon:yes stop_codon:yes gene_type:complete